MDIGNKIKKHREINNLSQEQLADKIFISRQTVSNWENNKFYPDIKSLSMLCNIFDVSLDDFIKGDIEEMKKKIEESDLKRFKTLAWVYTIELIIMVLSAYPLLKFVGIIGIAIWIVFTIITISTALPIGRIKKHYNLQTYKEILSFWENKTLSHDEKNIEFGKRNYQKFLLAIASGLIAVIVMIIMDLILKYLIF